MRQLIIGANGQVGRHLQHHLSNDTTVSLGRNEIDLSNPEKVQSVLETYRPDVILNAAAYTQVDLAEDDADSAFRINRDAVFQLAQYAKSHGALLVHYSTDYVFDGTKETPYHETDPANPSSVYGKSKKQGEDVIQASGCQHFIFRTSWVYCEQGKNFPNTILSVARKQDKVSIVSDQYGAPTHAETVASGTAHCLAAFREASDDNRNDMMGVYHLTNSGQTSWFEFAKYLIKGVEARQVPLRCKANNIQPIPSADFFTTAPRPANSSLDCSKICKKFDLFLESWATSAEKFIDNWTDENRHEA